MVRKKVDARVRALLERGVARNHRSLFVLVGDHGKDQVPNLHAMLSKLRVKARPNVLWCYKKVRLRPQRRENACSPDVVCTAGAGVQHS
eukprot:scaffold71_cov247-Pinguiococcus_pyrenoidosus.AAC.19